MSDPEPPKELVDFIRSNAQPKCKITLWRLIGRNKYQAVNCGEWSILTMGECEGVARWVHRAALKDHKDHGVHSSERRPTYKATIQTRPKGRSTRPGYARGGTVRSKHFQLIEVGEAAALRTRGSDPECTDCGDSKWYVGLHERKPCPTCQGG